MKKITLFALIIFTCTAAVAQNFKGGIIAGLSHSDIKGTDPKGVRFHKVGVTAGVFTQLAVSEKNTIRMELKYIQKGSYVPPNLSPDSIANGPDTSLKIRLNYVEIPLLFCHTLYFNIGQTVFNRLTFEVGPAIGVLVGSSVNLNQNGFGPVVGTQYNKLDVSYTLGFNYRITDNLRFHFRYENSLLPIRKHPSGASSYYNLQFNIGETNKVFTYRLSYTF